MITTALPLTPRRGICQRCGDVRLLPNGHGTCLTCLCRGTKSKAQIKPAPEPKPYMKHMTSNQYRAHHREQERQFREQHKHPCAGRKCQNIIDYRATLCRACAAKAREDRYARDRKAKAR